MFKNVFFSGKCIFNMGHYIIEYAELEGNHQNHRVQLMAKHSTPQEPHHVPENVVQMCL